METKILASLSRYLMEKVNKDEFRVEWKYFGVNKINVLGGRNFSLIFRMG